MKNFNLAIVALFILSGCATSAKYKEYCETWLNKSERALLETWGIPRNSYAVNEHTKMVEFIFDGGTVYNGDYLSMMSGGQYRVANECRTTFTVNDGLINAYRYEGKACRAR